jgi:hypothetical protein
MQDADTDDGGASVDVTEPTVKDGMFLQIL